MSLASRPFDDAALMRALGFDARQRDDNRLGRLGPGQWARALGWDTVLLLAFALALVAWTGHLLFGAPTDKHGVPLGPTSRAIGSLFSGLFGTLLGWFALERVRDVIDGHVATVEGATYLVVLGGKSTQYEWNVDGLHLDLPSRAAKLAMKGRRMRVHYLPRSKRVISAEDLG